MSHRRAAFTLIELLIVVSILSLLAALLFPVFARSRENARRSGCASNLRQIGLATLQYAQDYDQTLPPFSNYGFLGYDGSDGPRWADFIFPYVKNPQVFDCPNAPLKTTQYPGGQYFDITTYSYGITVPSLSRAIGVAGRPLTEIEDTAGTLMFVEDGREEESGVETKGRLVPALGESLEILSSRLDGSRHIGSPPVDINDYAFNALYTDGHVKWTSLSQTWRGGAMQSWTVAAD